MLHYSPRCDAHAVSFQISRKFGSVYSDKGQASVDVCVTAILVFLHVLLSQGIHFTSVTAAAAFSPVFFFFLICLQAQLNICSIPLVLIMYSKNPYRHNLTAHQRADSCAFLISHIISCVFVTFSFIIQTQKRQFKCGSGDLPRPRILFFNKGGVQSIILKVPDWKGIEPGIFS